MAQVLVVDSSDFCRELLTSLLELQGYAAAWATPQNAMELVRRSMPALMVVDPGETGSQGWALLATLCRGGNAGERPAIVIVSDQADKHHVLRAAKLGIRDYMLKKRFSLAEFLTRVRRHAAPGKTPAPPAEKIAPAAQGAAQVSAKTSFQPPATPRVPATMNPPARSMASPPAPASDERAAALEAARELGLKLLTREETLEHLESAPVKTLPGVVAELISLVNSPRGTVSDVAQVLRRDPVLTARILRVANSAGFATQRARIGTVEDAVKDLENIRRTVAGRQLPVLYAAGFSAVPEVPGFEGIRVQRLPLNIDLLDQFFTQAANLRPADAVARAA